ncbi:hypothetical protein RJ639_012066, partial [Escallonia herrerae]
MQFLSSLRYFALNLLELSSLDIAEENVHGSSPRVLSDDETEYETGSPKESTSDSEGQANSKSHSFQLKGFIRKLRKAPAKGLHTFHPSMPSVKKLSRKKSRNSTRSMPAMPPNLDAEFYCFESSWINFSLSDLQKATNSFSHVHVNHPNISNVIGYGVEGGMHLVLPLSPHGSLASLLTGEKEKLAWGIRYNIALGIASGLSYLHEGCQRRILHRDIKAANILLKEDFEPQISDFGLAKWLPDQWTHLTVSQFEGTFGYLPPEFFMQGLVDEKTDVYAYGVLLLELITGRPALDKTQKSLVMWAKPILDMKNVEELVDPLLAGAYDSEQMSRMLLTAACCLHQSSTDRPQMSQ